MHELSLAQSILEIVSNEALRHGVPEVSAVHISLGKFTHVVPASLRYCFDLIKEDGLARNAELVIRQVPLKTLCQDCGQEFLLEEPEFVCPLCGGKNMRVLEGRELWIDSIEAPEEEPGTPAQADREE